MNDFLLFVGIAFILWFFFSNSKTNKDDNNSSNEHSDNKQYNQTQKTTQTSRVYSINKNKLSDKTKCTANNATKTQEKQSDDKAKLNKQKGDKYELQIGKYYQKQGYKVYFKGLNEGVRDGGIDLVAYKDKDALLIQCKNWEHSQIKQEHLRIFLGDCTAYTEQNQKIFSKKNIRRVFVTSCKNMDYGVQKFIANNDMEYKIIPYEPKK